MTPLNAFSSLAESVLCLRLAQRLIQVSDVLDDHGPLSPVLRLLCATDSIQILTDWAEVEPRLQTWRRLGEKLWHARDVLASFPAVNHADVAGEVYRGDLKTMYLPAMAATWTPVADVAFACWLRRLKLWLVIKSVAAAEAGFAFEPNLRNLCREVRLACDREDRDRLSFFARVFRESNWTSRYAFESSLSSACNRLRGDEMATSGDRTLCNLISRVVSEQWQVDMETLDRGARPVTLAPEAPEVPGGHEQVDPGEGHHRDDDGDTDNDGGNQDKDGRVQVDPNSTPPGQELSADRVLLLTRAAGHMLPWDWHSLIATERFDLVDWIDSMLIAEVSAKSRAGAALAALALLTSRSARGVVRVHLGSEVADDWKVDLARGRLHRRPPRSRRGAKQASISNSADAEIWLRPLSDAWQLQLNSKIAQALLSAKPSDARTLEAVWNAVADGESLEHWFNTQVAERLELARLTSPALAGALRLCTYQASRDHVLARLASSSSESVLPSPCSYASFVGRTITQTAGSAFVRLGAWVCDEFDDRNAAGSELDVDDVQFCSALGRLASEVSQASERQDWVRHHNLLAAYVTLCLLASTGARPINSPFESLTWFDLDRGLVYIDDKAADRGSGSRICILARPVVALLRDLYIPHLRRFAAIAAPRFADFASALSLNIDGDPAPKVPFLFFIRFDSEFDWIEVTESGLEEQCGPSWPLPWNFARHRLSTKLRRVGLHAEIIDALMGHAEAGSESHGAHSLRVLGQDLEAARPHIERLTASLCISVPALCAIPELPAEACAARPLIQENRSFGSRRRHAQRSATHTRAKQQARAEIDAAVKAIAKSPTAVTPEQWDRIGRSMIIRLDRLRHPLASLRYAVFEEYLTRIWDEHGVKPRLKRRYRVTASGQTLMTDQALRAEGTLAQAAQSFEQIVSAFGRTSQPQLCRTLAAVEFCLVCGIADVKLLDQVAQYGRVKPVRYVGRWYIEAFEGDAWLDGAPVRRFEVTMRAVGWLLAGLKEKRTNSVPLPLPSALHPLATAIGQNQHGPTRRMLVVLAALVDQRNLLTRSGFEAAVLAGRLQVSALPHSDLVRSAEAQGLYIVPASDEVYDSPDDDEIESHDPSANPGVKSAEGCKRFLDSIRQVLVGSESREEIAREIRKLARQSRYCEGDLPNALARWSARLLTRRAKGSSQLLARDSVLRYFNALAPKVAAVGHDVHLIELDEEELTDIYSDLVRVRIRPNVSRSASGDAAVRAETTGEMSTSEPADTPASAGDIGDPYAVPVLMEFHEFAQHRFGLDEPDWSLIGDIAGRPAGRPGLITQREYEAALGQLVGSGARRGTEQHRLECAWVLILCYLFGSRGGEAVGLHRSDWVDAGGAIVVLVKPNATRGLKTIESKRPVPLIDGFTALEQTVVDEIIRRFEERGGTQTDTPLLSNLDRKNFKFRRIQITGTLLALLKAVSHSRRTTLHHARHSFCCRIFTRLTGRSLTDWRPSECSSDGENSIYSTRRLLLGHHGIDRRSLWALARLLGHTSPARLIASYAHPLVTALVTDRHSDNAAIDEPGFVDLDSYARSLDYLGVGLGTADPVPAMERAPQLSDLVNYLRVRRNGRSGARAAYVTGIAPETGERVEAVLAVAASRQEVLHAGEHAMTSAMELLCKLSDINLRALVSITDAAADRRPDDLAQAHELEMTFGRSGTCVLATHNHLLLAEGFVMDLGLTAADVHVVCSRQAEAIRQTLSASSLADITLSDQQREEQKIQVDTSSMRAAGALSVQVLKDRAALRITGGSTRLVSRYGLTVLWACYCVFRTSTPAEFIRSFAA